MWFSLALALITQAQGAPAPDRLDLGRAYMRFERTLARHPPEEKRVADLNRAFDALTADFFMGNAGTAITKLEALTRSIAPMVGDLDPERIDLLGSELEAVREKSGRLRVTLKSAGAAAAAERLEPALVEFRTWREEVGLFEQLALDVKSISRPLSVASTSAARSIEFTELEMIEGAYDAELGCPPVQWSAQRRGWFVGVEKQRLPIPEPFIETPGLVARRDEIAGILSAIEPDGPPLEVALASCRARAALLTAAALKTSTYLIGRNVHALAAQVHREAHALARGEDPYRRLCGDTWRVVRVGADDLPVRVFAPERGDPEKPLPLFVLFHGMGGDENMFFDGYGAGRIRTLAEERGFLCVAPRGSLRPFSAEAFDALVRALVFDYAIDTKRIYVVGHSLGAASAFELAVSRADRIAGAVCIAGGPSTAEPTALAPLLVVAGEIDPLVAAKPLIARGKRLAQSGFSVDCRTVPNQGHTLVVAATLPTVVDWLLAHTR
jgi:predicted esterase